MLRTLRRLLVVVAGCTVLISCGGDADEPNAGAPVADESIATAAGTTPPAALTPAEDVAECGFVDQAAAEALFGGPLHFVGDESPFNPPIESSTSCSFWERPDDGYVGTVTFDWYPSADAAAEDYDRLVAEYGNAQCWAGEEGSYTELEGVGEKAIIYRCGETIFVLQDAATIAVGVHGGRELPDEAGYIALASDIAARLAAG